MQLTESRGAKGSGIGSSRSGKSSRSGGDTPTGGGPDDDDKKKKERKRKETEERAKKDRKPKTPLENPDLSVPADPTERTLQHPGNIDPADFKGDLMDIYAPPGRGPPITDEGRWPHVIIGECEMTP
jgi:hypothetical protein